MDQASRELLIATNDHAPMVALGLVALGLVALGLVALGRAATGDHDDLPDLGQRIARAFLGRNS